MPVQIFYKPGKAPDAQEKEPKELGLFLERELGAIADSFAEHYYVKYQVLHVEPQRPREGMTVYADGSSWDPGHGKGVYVWSGTAWLPQSGQAAAFSVHKGGTDQTGIASATPTAITWPTEDYDVGGHFASDGWTPPAGRVSLTCTVYFGGAITVGSDLGLLLYKNGVSLKESYAAAVPAGGGISINVEDVANGTDVYTVWCYMTLSSGTAGILGNSLYSYFMGHWIGA